MLNWLKRRFRPKSALGWEPGARAIMDEDGFITLPADQWAMSRASAVWACIGRIAHRAAQAKFRVVDMDGGIVGHPLDRLLANPSGRIDTMTFQRYLAESLLTDGNAYALKVMGATGMGMMYPTALRLVPPHNVQITGTGRQSYIYTVELPSPGISSMPRAVSNMRLVHAKGAFYDTRRGKSASPVHAAAESIGLYRESVRSSKSFLNNASRFGGIMQTAIPYNEEESVLEQYREMMKQSFSGARNTGKIVFLPHGHELKAAPSMAKEMLLAEQLNWSVNEIARHFGVPLALIQHTNGVRQSTEELETALVQEAVSPLCAQIGAAFTERLLTPMDREAGYRVEADLSAFGMPTATGKAARAMTLAQTGVVTINEIRRGLGLPPVDGGDMYPAAAGAPERDKMGEDEDMPEEDAEGEDGSDEEDEDAEA